MVGPIAQAPAEPASSTHSWWAGPWDSQCISQAPCDSPDSTRSRPVECRNDVDGSAVAHSLCQAEPRPDATHVCSYPKCPAPPTAVQASLTLAIAIEQIPEGSLARQTFVATFEADVATALSIPTSRVRVTAIRAGSTKVDFDVLPDASGVALPDSAVATTFSAAGIPIAGSSTAAAVVVATFAWQTGAWVPTACASDCGVLAVNRTRRVSCIRSDNGVASQAAYCKLTPPRAIDVCPGLAPCPNDISSEKTDGGNGSSAVLIAVLLTVAAIGAVTSILLRRRRKRTTYRVGVGKDVESHKARSKSGAAYKVSTGKGKGSHESREARSESREMRSRKRATYKQSANKGLHKSRGEVLPMAETRPTKLPPLTGSRGKVAPL